VSEEASGAGPNGEAIRHQNQAWFAPKFYPGSTQEETEEQKQIAEVLDQSLRNGLITDKTIVAIELIPDGNTSAVYKLVDDSGDAIVLKTGWSTAWSHDVLAAEAIFLDRWHSCGVNTPVVIDFKVLEGPIKVPVLLMEYVAGQSMGGLLDQPKAASDGVERVMGTLQAKMHTVKATGYGASGDGNVHVDGGNISGRFASLRECLAGEGLEKKIHLGTQNGQIEARDRPAIERAIALLDSHASHIGPSLTHNDFHFRNLFYDPSRPFPYVVIDPTPALTHPYLCLAFNLILDEMHNGFASDHRLAGYSEVTAIVPNVLAAATVIKSCLMFPSWGKDRESAYARNLLTLYRRTLNTV